MESSIKDLLKEKKIEKKSGKILNKNQRLALEIIDYFKLEKKWHARWFMACKNCPAFIEDKFLIVKQKKIENGAGYLWRMIYQNKICNPK